MVLVDGIGELSTSIMGGCLYVAYVDNCSNVVNFIVYFFIVSHNMQSALKVLGAWN